MYRTSVIDPVCFSYQKLSYVSLTFFNPGRHSLSLSVIYNGQSAKINMTYPRHLPHICFEFISLFRIPVKRLCIEHLIKYNRSVSFFFDLIMPR